MVQSQKIGGEDGVNGWMSLVNHKILFKKKKRTRSFLNLFSIN